MKPGERGKARKITLGVIVFVVIMSIPCWAIPLKVVDIQLDLLADEAFNQVFDASGSTYDREFFVSQDYTTPSDTVIGQIKVQNDSTYNYEIRGGAITLTPSELNYEDNEPDYFGGTRAKAHFYAGATLTVTGSVWYVGGAIPSEYSPYGTIMVASVEDSFILAEEMFIQDQMFCQLDMLITGGDLATGAEGLQSLYPLLINDITLKSCAQGDPPAPMVNFTEDFVYNNGDSLMQIYPVPEPFTICLLGLGTLLLRKRKA